MKYCCEYFGEFAKVGYFDELIVHLRPNEDIKNIEDFFSKHKKQTIIIQVLDNHDFLEGGKASRILSLLPPLEYKYKFKLNNPFDEETIQIVEECKKLGIPYFFDILVDEWDVLNAVAAYEPTDMYIVNTLGFELAEVSRKLHKQNINIRVYPNIAQSRVSGGNSLCKFWIRPEDTDVYDHFVDVFEFLVDVHNNNLKELYYTIYAEEMMWSGPLNLIIAGLEEEIDNRGIFNAFPLKRIECAKACEKNAQCSLCYQLANISNMIVEKGYEIQYPQSSNRKTAWNRMTEEEKDELRKSLFEKIEKF